MRQKLRAQKSTKQAVYVVKACRTSDAGLTLTFRSSRLQFAFSSDVQAPNGGFNFDMQ